jgi:hypothetical protein
VECEEVRLTTSLSIKLDAQVEKSSLQKTISERAEEKESEEKND